MLRSKNYFQIAKKTTKKQNKKKMVLLTLLTKRGLSCNDLLSRNGRTQVNCLLGSNKYTSCRVASNF